VDGLKLSRSEQLMEQFVAHRGQEAEDAFAAIVQRHGPMVLRPTGP
jgi:hypothetical protein